MRAFPVISLVLSIALGIGAVFLGKSYFTGSSKDAAPTSVITEEVTAPRTTRILVANANFEAGDPFTIDDVRFTDWPNDMLPEGAMTSRGLLRTSADTPFHARGVMVKGEPVLLEKLSLQPVRTTLSTSITDGFRAVSIQVSSVTGVAGFVLPDDRVDIIMVSEVNPGSRNSDSKAEVILQDVRVLAVDQTVQTESDGAISAETVTLEVTPVGAARISLAADIGKLSLALRGKTSSDAATTQAANEVVRLPGRRTPRLVSGARRTPSKTDIRLIQGDTEETVETPVAEKAEEANS